MFSLWSGSWSMLTIAGHSTPAKALQSGVKLKDLFKFFASYIPLTHLSMILPPSEQHDISDCVQTVVYFILWISFQKLLSSQLFLILCLQSWLLESICNTSYLPLLDSTLFSKTIYLIYDCHCKYWISLLHIFRQYQFHFTGRFNKLLIVTYLFIYLISSLFSYRDLNDQFKMSITWKSSFPNES